MRAHGNEGRLGGRFAIVIGVAAAGAAVIAAGASADFSSVHDPRGDANCHRGGQKPCLNEAKRNADIVRATAGHEGTQLRHTIRVVGKFQAGWLTLNTDSDPQGEWALDIERGEGNMFPQNWPGGHGAPAEPGGGVKVEFHRHSVEVFFRESQIGNPPGYGWKAGAGASVSPPPLRGFAEDDVPRGRDGYIRHELG